MDRAIFRDLVSALFEDPLSLDSRTANSSMDPAAQADPPLSLLVAGPGP